MSDMEGTVIPTCPECGSGNLYAIDTCHTWGGDESGKGWMACMGCFTALRFCCEECRWCYTWGLNPRNPRSARNDESRPAWLGSDSFGELLPAGWEWPDGEYLARPIGWVDPEESEDTPVPIE